MTSSVTKQFNEVILDTFKADLISDSADYHIVLSRGEELSELPANISDDYFQRQFRHRMSAVKTLANNSFVIPRVNWSSGTSYPAYDTNVDANYHVMNSNNEIFICVEQGKEADGTVKVSTEEPTRTKAANYDVNGNTGRTFVPSPGISDDGYRWRYLYTLSNIAISNFLTTNWIPVKKITSTTPLTISEEELQRRNQDSARAGEIIGLAIDSGGTGYEVAPTITIVGNGDSAQFTCDIAGGKIVRVRVDSDGDFDGTFLHGSGYDYASVTLSSGDGVLRPILSPPAGLNAVPLQTLGASALMLQVDFVGDETDTLIAENDFHQIGIIRNLKKTDGTAAPNTSISLKSLIHSSSITGAEDKLMTSGDNLSQGKVFATTATRIYYWQDETTGFTPFDADVSATVNIDTVGNFAFTDESDSPIDAYTGEVLYINNIGAEGEGTPTSGIDRSDNQTEDIRVIIELG